jgi:Cd2+/Zn2+-exporting ATPase
VDRSRRAITRLLELAPEYADRLLPNGTTERVQANALARGDKVRVRPGDRLPADGVVVSGISSVNEATITGESLPVAKRAGDRVFAGTLNTDGALDIEVEADAAHSTLARIVQLVRQAEGRRAPVEEFVQRFARIYTPAVTLLAFLIMVIPPLFVETSALDWFLRGITLLVIACPCALVIATPVTVVSALTSAARHGVLIKGGVYLETLGRTRALAVDKTGTLTTGALAVTHFQSRGTLAPNEHLGRIATLEARSEHPIGEAIVRFAEQKAVGGGGTLDAFTAVPGYGIRGRVNGIEMVVGTEELVGAAMASRWNPPRPGTMQVYATSSDDVQGLIILRDEVRSVSKQVVAQLHASGVRPVVMLTGDASAAADAVGADVGVDEVRSRLLPEEKVEVVRSLREQYGTVAMLGDGVNDAPALAEASVGIAMGAAGSPAAIEAADVALMSDDLTKLPYAIRLARKARHTIRFNIAFAIGIKLILAVGAVAGLVSLAAAVLVGDMGGALAVTLNALRLAAFKPDSTRHT